jgi:predicted nucleic acid-binding protein
MFVDTNVLVYASVQGAPNRDSARAALAHHASSGETLRISRQILREFVAVTTRPQTWARAQTCADAAISAAALAQERGDGLSDAATSGKQLTCRQIPRDRATSSEVNAVAVTIFSYALARQLQAAIKMVDANPGTAVTVAHTQIAAVQTADAKPADRAV